MSSAPQGMMDTMVLTDLTGPMVLMGVLGLVIGSFLNVVVRRWPLIMERRWWSEASQQMQDEDSLRRAWGTAVATEVPASAPASSPTSAPPAAPSALSTHATALHQGLMAQPELSLSRPASHCPACGHTLKWHELIPVLSWLMLKGRCSACGAPIGVRYPFVELATAALFMAMAWRWGPDPLALLWSAWGATLLALALIDWDTLLLPDDLTLPLVWAGLAAAALGWTISPKEAIAGAVWGWGSLWVVATVFRWITGKEGMGGGDFKLLAALGAWLGPVALVAVVLVASLMGALVGLVMKAQGALREGRYVPFGPFLAGGGLLVALVGEHTLWAGWSWWLGWAMA